MKIADEMRQSSLITGRKSILFCLQEKFYQIQFLSFIWEAPSLWDCTWNLARDGFNARVKCYAAAATEIQPIHKPLKACSSLIKDRRDVSNCPVSSHPVVAGDGVGLSLGTLLWQQDWDKQPGCSQAWVCKPCKNAVWVCTCAGIDPDRDLSELGWSLQTPARLQAAVGSLSWQLLPSTSWEHRGSLCCSLHWA